jgi:hypothetical protein
LIEAAAGQQQQQRYVLFSIPVIGAERLVHEQISPRQVNVTPLRRLQ